MTPFIHAGAVLITALLASYCSVSVGPSFRIGIKELHDVVLQPDDVPAYLSRTDEGVMQEERLKVAENGYGMFYELRESTDLPPHPMKVILSESILYKNSQLAGETVKSRPSLMIEEVERTDPGLPAREISVGQIGQEAVAVRLDITPLNDVQYTIVFRQGRVLGHLMIVASRDYGPEELLHTGEQLAAVMAERMASLPDNGA